MLEFYRYAQRERKTGRVAGRASDGRSERLPERCGDQERA